MVCVSFIQRPKVNGWVKLRYWQQVWQLHVKGVAMVTGHSQLSHSPPSLSVSPSHFIAFAHFFFFFCSQLFHLIPADSFIWLWWPCGGRTFSDHHWRTVQRHDISTSHSRWEDTSVAGSGIMPSCLDGFFPESTIIGGRKKKTKASPEQIITSWQEKLSCSAAEQGSCVSQTQMSHCFLLPCLRCWGH